MSSEDVQFYAQIDLVIIVDRRMIAAMSLITKTPSEHNAIAPRPRTTRSRVTNGKELFVSRVDGRTAEARRFRDVLAEIVSDLGGAEGLSEGQRQLARRCAMMAVECEKVEAMAVAGKPIDLEAFGKMTDRIGRAFQRLGIKRTLREMNLTPLADHFKRPPAKP